MRLSIRDIQKDLDRKVNKLTKSLAQHGVNEARKNFNDAIYAGSKDGLRVYQSGDGKERYVIAEGTAAPMIEFGTGIYPNDHEEAGRLGIQHGTYGQGKGAHPPWYYTGEPGNHPPSDTEQAYKHPHSVRTFGNPANSSLLRSRQSVEENFERIAREVFK